MDFIYSKLDNNLVDINRLKSITLLKCEQENVPFEGLNVGDYYLKFTIVDSDRISYCNLSQLNEEINNLDIKLTKEIERLTQSEQDITNKLDTIETLISPVGSDQTLAGLVFEEI